MGKDGVFPQQHKTSPANTEDSLNGSNSSDRSIKNITISATISRYYDSRVQIEFLVSGMPNWKSGNSTEHQQMNGRYTIAALKG